MHVAAAKAVMLSEWQRFEVQILVTGIYTTGESRGCNHQCHPELFVVLGYFFAYSHKMLRFMQGLGM